MITAYFLIATFVLGAALGADWALKVKRELWEYLWVTGLALVWPISVALGFSMWVTWSRSE